MAAGYIVMQEERPRAILADFVSLQSKQGPQGLGSTGLQDGLHHS